MNWKIAVGILLIIGAMSQMLTTITDYASGKLAFWPLGIEVGFVAMISLAVYLIRKGKKEKTLR